MIRLQMHRDNPHSRYIAKAVEILQEGGVIVYPTDTVYGIGCNLYNKKALERIYRLKGKSKFDPVSLILKDIPQASQYVRISNFAFRLIKRCFPGPYTFILQATREIPKTMLTKRKEIGIRIPENTVCKTLLEAFQNPIVNTSVTSDSKELLTDPDEIAERFVNDVDVMLDAGWLPDARESTVVRLVDDELSILREGKGELGKLFD